MADFSIRPMSETHLEEVAQIELSSKENLWNKTVIEDHLMAENHYGIMAYAADALQGYAVFELIFDKQDKWLQLWNLVVDPRFRRKGVGKFLIGQMKLSESHRRIVACVRESNTEAQLFLQRQGFWCDSISRNYFIDRISRKECREDGYCFEYHSTKERKKDVPIRITDRFGVAVTDDGHGRRAPEKPIFNRHDRNRSS